MKNLLSLWLLYLTSVTALAHPSVGIVQDSRGNVFYTDLKQVWKIAPDGKKTDLKKRLKRTTADGVEGKKVTGYTFVFTPPKRGDYVVVAVSPAVKVEGQKLPVKDVAKVVLHAQTQNGWDNIAVDDSIAALDLQPLTRPYGLMPGAAFHVDVLDVDAKPVENALERSGAAVHCRGLDDFGHK